MATTTWLRSAATFITILTMVLFGFTSITSAQTISNTGPGSTNTITSNNTNNCRQTNTTNISVNNTNQQNATSGNASETNNTGPSWSGWGALDPASAQANGQNYSSWWGSVVNWVSQRASGTGWNSTETNLAWVPTSADWSAFDPTVWQANGQNFANWYTNVETFLNTNSSTWLLSWPTDATSTDGFGGATSGNATNNFNVNFSININNAARATAGTDSCGRSLFVPPPVGGSGGGVTTVSKTSRALVSTPTVFRGGGTGHYTARPIVNTVQAQPAQVQTSVANQTSPPAPVIPPSTPPVANNTITNTGPGSTNTITSNNTNNSVATNTNNVVIGSINNQTATSGGASASSNTGTGGGASGDATNNTGSGIDTGISS